VQIGPQSSHRRIRCPSIQHLAENVVSGRDCPEADDSAEERQGRNLNPPDTVVRREGDRGQEVVKEIGELIPDATDKDVQPRSAPDGIPDPFHALRLAFRDTGRIGQQW